MTVSDCECRVTVAEIAEVLTATVAQVENFAAELGLPVGADWAVRPALSTADAGRLVAEARSRREQSARDGMRRQAEAEARVAAGRRAWVTEQENAMRAGGVVERVQTFDSYGHVR